MLESQHDVSVPGNRNSKACADTENHISLCHDAEGKFEIHIAVVPLHCSQKIRRNEHHNEAIGHVK